jgi:methionyl-tRNA formyltransferase
VHRAEPAPANTPLSPGVLAIEGTRLLVGCGQGTTLDLIEIQVEGKRRMAAAEFINGYRPKTGDHLGQ